MRILEEVISLHETTGEDTDRSSTPWSDHADFKPVADLDRASRRYKIATQEGFAVWRQWGSGPALVMLHGGSGSWSHFYRQVEAFSGKYRVIVPDLPGFGDSADSVLQADPDQMARILAAGIDKLAGPEPIYLVGFSYGGIIGGYLARLIASRLSGFVLVGGVGFEARRNRVDLTSWRRLSGVDARRDAHRNNLAAIMIADPARIDPTAILIQQANAERSRHDTRPTAQRKPLTALLDESKAPLAAIWGEYDQLAAPYFDERRKWLAERDPDALFKLVADAGHWVQYEAADAFNEALAGSLHSFAQRGGVDRHFQGGQHGR